MSRLRSQSSEGESLLKIASRHLNYILTDSELNSSQREYRRNKVAEFYSDLFKNLGMMDSLNEWQRDIGEQYDPSDKLYSLHDLLSVLKVENNNLSVFRALQCRGAKILYKDYKGKKGFFVDRENAGRIISDLQNRGLLSLEGKI